MIISPNVGSFHPKYDHFTQSHFTQKFLGEMTFTQKLGETTLGEMHRDLLILVSLASAKQKKKKNISPNVFVG